MNAVSELMGGAMMLCFLAWLPYGLPRAIYHKHIAPAYQNAPAAINTQQGTHGEKPHSVEN